MNANATQTPAATVSALKAIGIAARVRDLNVKFRVCLKSEGATTADQRAALVDALNTLGFCWVNGRALTTTCFNGAYEVCAYLPSKIRFAA